MKPSLSHEEIEELEALLPWYVNGTLDQASQAKIAAALGHHTRLRASLAAAREDAEAVLQAAGELGAPSRAVLDRIMAATEPPAIVTAGATLRERFKAFLVSLSPQSLALAGSAAALLIVVQGAALGWLALDGERSAGPELASQDPAARGGEGVLIVKFADSAALADVSAALDRLDLTIVEGPTGNGLYIVGYRPDAEPRLAAAELARRLTENSALTDFAAPMEKQEE